MLPCVKSLWSFTPITTDNLRKPHPLRQINHYLLRQKIGSGSSSQVYLAIDQRTGQTYAVKRIKLADLIRSSTGLAQLEREIRVMRVTQHPNILRLIEVIHVKPSDEVFLVLEYAKLGSIGSFIERDQDLSVDSIFSILKQVINGLKYLHNSGFIHQDVKPWNILLDGTGRAMLADFGVGHSFASAGMVVGSPAYQAPEVLDDSYGSDEEGLDEPQKEDVWALGVTLYQLLFKELPFMGSTLFEIVNSIHERPLRLPEGTDPEIAKLIQGMLTVDPMSRLGIDDLLNNPLIRNAAERVTGLPEVPEVRAREGPILEVHGEVCGEGYSFADFALPARRRASLTISRENVLGLTEDAGNRRSSWGVEERPAIWMGVV